MADEPVQVRPRLQQRRAPHGPSHAAGSRGSGTPSCFHFLRQVPLCQTAAPCHACRPHSVLPRALNLACARFPARRGNTSASNRLRTMTGQRSPSAQQHREGHGSVYGCRQARWFHTPTLRAAGKDERKNNQMRCLFVVQEMNGNLFSVNSLRSAVQGAGLTKAAGGCCSTFVS